MLAHLLDELLIFTHPVVLGAGRPLFDSYQIENPKVQTGSDMAILTYQLVTQNGSATRRWNATEVYQKKTAGWRVIHTHFSTTAGAQ